MKDTLKTLAWKGLRFLLSCISPPESYRSMKARHEWEVEVFQKHCQHKHTTLDYAPFVACANCCKVLHLATEEEQESARTERLFKINRELEGQNVKLEFPPSECDCEGEPLSNTEVLSGKETL